jgi:transposase
MSTVKSKAHKKNVDPDTFIRALFASNGNAKAVSDKLGMSVVNVYNRVKRYRALGAKLPKSNRPTRRLDKNHIIALCKDLSQQ